MSPSFTGVYVPPGGYVNFKPTTSFPVIPGGIRVVAIVGKGATDKPIIGETVTMTATATYSLAHTATVINSITDNNFYEYVSGTDYELNSGKVHWLQNNAVVVSTNVADGVTATYGSMNGLTLVFSIDGGTPLTCTMTASTTGNVRVAYLVNSILGAVATTTALSTVSVVEIKTISGANSSIVVGNGTANTIVGFIAGAQYIGSANPVSVTVVGATPNKFFVDYRYEKVAVTDYVPAYYYNMNDIESDFGSTTVTLNTLSLGAEAAFENGAQVVLATQVDPGDGADFAGYKAALVRLESKACNIVSVMTYDVNLLSYIKAHVDKMSSLLQKSERTAIVGMDDSPSVTTIQSHATTFGDKRVMLVYPTTERRMINSVETSIGSYLMAAALAGIRCNPNYDVAEPLTRKPIVGFTEITDNLSNAQKNDLASHGVCIVESDSAGIPRVRHALTTDMTTVQNREYSITETTDYVGQVARQILEQMYVGTKILADTPLMVAATLTTVLNNLITRGIITEFTGLTASIDTTDPTEINVRFGFKPTYPCNFVYIEFSINA